jgi:hypothetical protein
MIYLSSQSTGAAEPSTPKAINLFLLAGQSNMVGLGQVEDVQEKLNTLTGYQQVSYLQLEAGEGTSESFGSWTPRTYKSGKGAMFGVELPLGELLAKRLSGQHAIVKIAKGSTGLAGHWHPESPMNLPGFYAHFRENAHLAIQALEKEGYQVNVRGFFWYQGEWDANKTPEIAAAYASNLRLLKERVRENFGQPELPIITVRVNPTRTDGWVYRDEVRLAIVEVAEADAFSAWVSVDDLEHPDNLHVDSAGLFVLGTRLFDAWCEVAQPADLK